MASTGTREPDGFAEALRAAIAARGVSLVWLRDRLAYRGSPVSLTTLSYWRSGDRHPEGAGSYAAIREIENLLGLPEDALASKDRSPPPRRSAGRGGAAVRSQVGQRRRRGDHRCPGRTVRGVPRDHDPDRRRCRRAGRPEPSVDPDDPPDHVRHRRRVPVGRGRRGVRRTTGLLRCARCPTDPHPRPPERYGVRRGARARAGRERSRHRRAGVGHRLPVRRGADHRVHARPVPSGWGAAALGAVPPRSAADVVGGVHRRRRPYQLDADRRHRHHRARGPPQLRSGRVRAPVGLHE